MSSGSDEEEEGEGSEEEEQQQAGEGAQQAASGSSKRKREGASVRAGGGAFQRSLAAALRARANVRAMRWGLLGQRASGACGRHAAAPPLRTAFHPPRTTPLCAESEAGEEDEDEDDDDDDDEDEISDEESGSDEEGSVEVSGGGRVCGQDHKARGFRFIGGPSPAWPLTNVTPSVPHMCCSSSRRTISPPASCAGGGLLKGLGGWVSGGWWGGRWCSDQHAKRRHLLGILTPFLLNSTRLAPPLPCSMIASEGGSSGAGRPKRQRT